MIGFGQCISGDCENGFGTYILSSGNKYKGEWKDGNFHGQGTFTWTSGKKYVGEWKDHMRNGQGTFTWANGDEKKGRWKGVKFFKSIYFFTTNQIEYEGYNHYKYENELIAVVDSGNCSSFNSLTKGCFSINKIDDFNDDGYLDVMISYCGVGAGTSPPFNCIFSYNGKEFVSSSNIGESDWDGIEVINENGQFIFIEDFNPAGRGYTDLNCNDIKRKYIFNKNDFELLKSNSDNELIAVKEIRSSDFNGSYNEIKNITFDLDNDGLTDVINCSYWERWGVINSGWTINFGNGIVFKSELQPKRIGVLKTKTKNVNDLVIDCKKILKWNGSNYLDIE